MATEIVPTASNVIPFPARGIILQQKVEAVERQVEEWLRATGDSWLAYSEQIARWAVDPALPATLRKFEEAGGRVEYERIHGRKVMFDGVCAELAAEFLAS